MGDVPDKIRSVGIPEAGEGLELYFSSRDFLELQTKFGDDYAAKAPDLIFALDINFMSELIRIGTKKDRVRVDPPILIEALDDKLSLHEIGERLLDAFFLRLSGRTYKEHATWIGEQIAKGLAKNPLVSPGTTSAGSDEPLTGPDSDLENSGS